jgi:acyl-CoA reductase-like NAD-dependent aldehyde dehydrogenase
MRTADNYVSGTFVPPSSGQYLSVTCPSNGEEIGRVGLSDARDVEAAVYAAQQAFVGWSTLTLKARAAIMLRFHALVRDHAGELADLIVLENGKNRTEALADVAKGNETVEYACSLPQLAQGRTLQVSTAVNCQDERRPLGVVVSVVPFNFPFMVRGWFAVFPKTGLVCSRLSFTYCAPVVLPSPVRAPFDFMRGPAFMLFGHRRQVPMWTFPIAVVMGNCFILKPSEKVPFTMHRVASLMEQAGFPPGVFGMVQGSQGAVQALIQHPMVRALTFVGSSPVAQIVSDACRPLHKRCTSLGGAKNHLVALSDCDVETAASDICVSFAGCAGQRCMAASVLLTVGSNPILVNKVVEAAAALKVRAENGEMIL